MKKYFLSGMFGGFLAVLLSAGLLIAQSSIFEIQATQVVYRATNPSVSLNGTLSYKDMAGTTIGSLASTGQVSGSRKAYVTAATTQTLTQADCGSVIVANHTTATQVFTLPAIGVSTGCMFTFIAGDAGTELQFKTPAVATCVFTHFAAVGTDADTAIVTDTSCEGGIKNTGATNAIGDSITIVSDGVRWLGVGIASGIWAVV